MKHKTSCHSQRSLYVCSGHYTEIIDLLMLGRPMQSEWTVLHHSGEQYKKDNIVGIETIEICYIKEICQAKLWIQILH